MSDNPTDQELAVNRGKFNQANGRTFCSLGALSRGAAHIGGIQLRDVLENRDQLVASIILPLARRMFFLFSLALSLGAGCLHSQCPSTRETKVIRPNQGSGYYFHRFLGDSSFRYFLDGKSFSYNDTDDPGRTFFTIDDIAYESILVTRADLAEYVVESSKPIDVLRAQAKHHQDYFRSVDPSMIITDYGPSPEDSPNGSEDRVFYLWKKESPPGKKAATQYLCSTLIKGGVVVLSIMPLKPSISQDDVFLQLQKYTSHFDLLSGDQCARVLSMPTGR